jgi:hypothetical protein
MKQEATQERIKCSCGVPRDIHGTCCGFMNAKMQMDQKGVIIDPEHPGFRMDLNQYRAVSSWMATYLGNPIILTKVTFPLGSEQTMPLPDFH